MDFWIVQSLNGIAFGMLLFLLAAGLSLVFGLMRIVNLTHGSFYLLGAYIGLTVIERTGSCLVALVVAPLCVTLLALLMHRFLLRRFHRMELAQVLWGIAYGWRTMTGGDDGLPGITRPDLGVLVPWSLQDPANFFTAVLIVFVVVVAALYLVVHSPFGYTLRGIRDSETRMDCLGYNVWLHKYVAFLIAGGVAGIAGILFVYYHGFVSPAELSLVQSAEGLLMVIVGGAGTLFGPVLGAGVVVFLRNIASAYMERWLLVLGLVYLLVVLCAPRGMLDALQARLPRWLSRRATL